MRACREESIAEILNSIVDPCSVASGVPVGLVDMGVIESFEVSGSTVRVGLFPTFPGCLYVGIFEAEIVKRIGALDWCTQVVVALVQTDAIWDETRMSETARSRLKRARAARALAAQKATVARILGGS